MEGQLFAPDDGPPRTRTGVPAREAPRAVRVRPATVDEVVGQQHLLGDGTALRQAPRPSPPRARSMSLVVAHLTANGVMEPELLYEPPFTDIATGGPEGIFADAEVVALIGVIEGIRANAQPQGEAA